MTGWSFTLCVGFFILGHFAYLDTPLVNNEYLTIEAAKGLVGLNQKGRLDYFFSSSGNPLGHPIVVALISFMTGYAHWAIRLPSLISGTAILFAGWLLWTRKRAGDSKLFLLWVVITLSNPVIWIFSARATSEMLHAGLLTIALLICHLARGRMNLHMLGGLVFAYSIITRFASILFVTGFIYLIFFGNNHQRTSVKDRSKQLLCYTLIPCLVSAIYLLVIYSEFGFFYDS